MKSVLRSFSIMILLLFLYAGNGFAQERIIFCESVDDNGNIKGEGTYFTIDENGSYVFAFVNLGLPVMSEYAYFYIYTVDDNERKLNDSFKMSINEEWEWFYTDINFYDEGMYEIEVYDDTDYLLANGTINISYR